MLPPNDPPRLGGKAMAIAMVDYHRKWIEWCEQNGRSYAGPKGPAIRKADEAALGNALLQQLRTR